MNISITFRNSEVDKWQREFIEDKITKLRKYIDGPCEAHVVLAVEKFRQVAEINFLANGLNINSKEEAKEMSLAIDNAIEKVERQLKKHREKIREHKTVNRASGEPPAPDAALNQTEVSTTARIAEFRKVVLRHLSPEDAVLEMETQDSGFVVYRDASNGRICVLYRLNDGNYALLETNG